MKDEDIKKEILKNKGYTDDYLDECWEKLCKIDSVIKNVSDKGKNWRDLNVNVAAYLPEKIKEIEEGSK